MPRLTIKRDSRPVFGPSPQSEVSSIFAYRIASPGSRSRSHCSREFGVGVGYRASIADWASAHAKIQADPENSGAHPLGETRQSGTRRGRMPVNSGVSRLRCRSMSARRRRCRDLRFLVRAEGAWSLGLTIGRDRATPRPEQWRSRPSPRLRPNIAFP
jgi:hypothetical protein